jgi:transposase-like protein
MERDFLEEMLAAGMSLERIALVVDKDPSTVGYWVKKHGLTAAHRARHAPKGGLAREDLERAIASGASIRGIAADHGVSGGTVKHWLRKYGLETSRAARLRASEAAHRTEREVVQMRCPRHGLAPHILEGRGSFRCTRCRSEWVSARRRRVKEILVREAGGRCRRCGFAEHPAALHFHHVDPAEKEFTVSGAGVTRSLARTRAEARKCVLLCSNCHALVEAGVATL